MNTWLLRKLSTALLSLVFVGSLCALKSTASAENYAILIGVADYERGFPQLPYDIDDVKGLGDVLINRKIVAKDNLTIMTTAFDRNSPYYPTALNVLEQLQKLQDRITPQDTLFFYFSGHGVVAKSEKDQNEMQYLLTPEARSGNFDKSALSLGDLKSGLSKIKAGLFITIIDACRTPIMNGKAPVKGLSIDESDAIKKISKDSSTAVIFSCNSDEVAQVLDDGLHRNSVFTYYLIQAFDGKALKSPGQLDVDSIFQYTHDAVIENTKKRGLQQHPRISTDGSSFVIVKHFVPTLPATLILRNVEPNTIVEFGGKEFSARSNEEINMNDEQPLQTTIKLKRFGYRTQTIPIKLESGKQTTPVSPGPWVPDDTPRVRLCLGSIDKDKHWIIHSNLPYWDDRDKVFSGPKDVKARTSIKTDPGVFDVFLSQSDQRLAVQLEGQGIALPIKWTPNAVFVVDQYGSSVKIQPEPLLKINITHYHRSELIYVIPEGAEYHLAGSGSNQVLMGPSDVALRAYSSKEMYALTEMGWAEEQRFWQINLEDGKMRRYTITAKRENGRVPPMPLEAPDRPDDTDTTLSLPLLPDDAKIRIAIGGRTLEKNLVNHQIRVEMESYRANATLSVIHRDWDATKYITIKLVSGQPLDVPQTVLIPLQITESSLELTSPTPGLTIIAIDHKPYKGQGTRLDHLKIGETLHLTLTAENSLLKEIDIKTGSDRNITVEMEPHAITNLPKGVLVKVNPKDKAKMVWIPSGVFPVGGGKSYDKRHELPSDTLVGGYWIYAEPVTFNQYQKFCRETNRKLAKNSTGNDAESSGQNPVTFVNADDAKAYASWAGGALQKETEWEYAVQAYHLVALENHLREWCQSVLASSLIIRGRKRGNLAQIFTWREEERPNAVSADLTFRVVFRSLE